MIADETEGSASEVPSFDDSFKWLNAYGDKLNDNYATMELQAELLHDRLFREFRSKIILQNKHLFKDKIVLEVDCGLGLCSLFISEYAKKVIAVEASYLADLLSETIAKKNIKNVIVVKDHIDDIESLPGDVAQVDIVISQYMGFLLYDKQLLARLLVARDKFLKKDGIMMPDCIQLFIAGFDSGNVARSKRASDLKRRIIPIDEPKNEIVSKNKICTKVRRLRRINLSSFKIASFDFTNEFHLTVTNTCNLDAFVFYFEIGYTQCHNKVFLSTGPEETRTRWQQMIFYPPEAGKPQKKYDTVTAEFTYGETIRESRRMIHFKLKICNVRSLAEYDLMYQRWEAQKRPVNKIISHPSLSVVRKC